MLPARGEGGECPDDRDVYRLTVGRH
jgi:hypothetical protein